MERAHVKILGKRIQTLCRDAKLGYCDTTQHFSPNCCILCTVKDSIEFQLDYIDGSPRIKSLFDTTTKERARVISVKMYKGQRKMVVLMGGIL